MFRRILFENWIGLFPLIALITATSVYATIFHRALRMKRPQLERMSNLPLADDEKPVTSDESR